MKDILKVFTKKREDQKDTLACVSEGDFPYLTDDLVSLIEFLGEQMKSERFFLELSEGGRYGAMCANLYLLSKLKTIKDRNDNVIKEV